MGSSKSSNRASPHRPYHGLRLRNFHLKNQLKRLKAHTFKGLLGLRINDTAPVISLYCLDQVETALPGVWGFSCIPEQLVRNGLQL